MPTEAPYIIRREAVAIERTLADVRLVLWFATAAITGRLIAEGLGKQPWMVVILLVFLAYTAGMWVVVRRFPRSLRPVTAVASLTEVILISALVWSSYLPSYWAAQGSSHSPFYLWYVFYVVSIALRYGLQFSIVGLSASVVLYTIVCMYPRNPVIYVPGFLGDTGFLFILAFLFGHISERQRSYQTRLAAVNQLGVALASLSTSREIIGLLVVQTAGLLGAGRCWFVPHTRGDGIGSPIVLGIEESQASVLAAKLGEWSPASILDGGQVLASNKPRRDPGISAGAIEPLSLRSLAAVPLYVRHVPVGVLYVADKLPHGFSGYDVELLELIAAQAAPIIENIQLWERLKEAAAAEERLRIARDLHDNFLQTLSAIKLYLERCRLLIDRDNDRARSLVERMDDISSQSLSEVRSYLSQLRLMGPEPSVFKEAVERCALEAAARAGFAVHTNLDITEGVLTPQTSLTAFQILRELLNNVVKHAEAASVWVTARQTDGGVEIEVRDDGTGFDLQARTRASARGHLGLLGIEERVRELDGKLEIETEPGKGTRAHVFLPLGDVSRDS